MSDCKNALHLLMKNARESRSRSLGVSNTRKRLKATSSPGTNGGIFFDCPAGCGAQVTERDVNSHLDRCTASMGANDDSVFAGSQDAWADINLHRKNAEQKVGRINEVNHFPPEKAAKTEGIQQEFSAKTRVDNLSVLKRRSETESYNTPGTKLDFDRKTEHDTLTNNSLEENFPTKQLPKKGDSPLATKNPAMNDGTQNVFSHMMKRSAALFSNSENVTRQRFHLHNIDGFVTWTSEYEEENGSGCNPTSGGKGNEDGRCIGNNDGDDLKSTSYSVSSPKMKHSSSSCFTHDSIQWSATITIKKPLIVNMQNSSQNIKEYSVVRSTKRRDYQPEKSLELTISSTIPFPQEGQTRCRLVRVHSRLSVPNLKSCLQKSIRRRAPLPAVRVAMELADKSWGDLIRRLPIIVLEDSVLHPDFPLLVWLMVADSKNFIPPMPLLVRVMQIVFEIAACPRQDTTSAEFLTQSCKIQELPESISLSLPSLCIFPKQPLAFITCETLIRSILLRAQYGGMSCDVRMLQKFSITWFKRFHVEYIPPNILSQLLVNKDGIIETDESKNDLKSYATSWHHYPELVHERARERSQLLVTSKLVSSFGLDKLKINDVCTAGIDFHCTSVVDVLLSNPNLATSLREKFAGTKNIKENINWDWLSRQIKLCIWKYSSGVNHRLPIVPQEEDDDEAMMRSAWDDVIKAPFNEFTTSFVIERLSI